MNVSPVSLTEQAVMIASPVSLTGQTVMIVIVLSS